MQTEIQQVRAEFVAWAAAQTDEGIKSRCQIILSNQESTQQTLRNVADLRLYGVLTSDARSKMPSPAPLVEFLT